MQATATPLPSVSTGATGRPAEARHDIYVSIHKALRHFMLDTLLRVGSLEVTDEAEVASVLGQVDALLAQCRAHIEHENHFVHPALEAANRGISARIAHEHDEHHEAIAALAEEVRQLRAAAPARRVALALRLYHQLSLFVADNFHHMHHEESAHNAALWDFYSDAELEALHGRLLASLPPREVFQVSRWMIPAMAPRERADMLAGVRATAPEGVFEALVDHVRPHLDDTAWSRLALAIGEPR